LMASGEPPTIAGAGRTDAGVHALAQVASATLDLDLPTDAIHRALNVRLPADVRVLGVDDAPTGFHAQFHASGKAYRYRVATGAIVSPFDRWFVWHVPGPRDLDAMREAARALIGKHDFASFQASGSEMRDTTRTIARLDLRETDAELHIDVEGDGFLRH